MDLARLDGDRRAMAGAGREIEAVLEEPGDGFPVLVLGREQQRPFDGGRQQGIVFEGRAQAAPGARAIAGGDCMDAGESQPEGRAFGAAELRGQAFEQPRRACAVAGGEADLDESFEGRGPIDLELERALIGALGLGDVAEMASPDMAELGLELRPLVGRHLGRALDLCELEHHVPLATPRVDAAELAQGGAIRRIEARELPVGRSGGVEVDHALLEDLSEAEQQGTARNGIGLDARGGEAVPVDAHEGDPVAGEEEMFLERLEGAAIVGVACEDLLLRVETFGQGFLVAES
jgi:hypothetical protein